MKLLIVDDCEAVRKRLAKLLSAIEGVKIVGEAADIPAAQAAISALDPDVLILDLQLPSGSGLAILHWLREQERLRQMLIVMLTNEPSDYLRDQCLAAGAQYFFDKTTQLHNTIAVLKAAAKKKRTFLEGEL